MSPTEDRVPIREISDDDHRFDLLADGELSEPQRRELLGQLDDEPGGWRRCALAFLEAQSWKQDFGAILRNPDPQPPASRPDRPFRLSRHRGTLVAMAASFLAALFLGWLLQDAWRGSAPGDVSPMHMAGVKKKDHRATEPARQPHEPPVEAPQPPDVPSAPWRMVGDAESFHLPAVERDQLDERWLQQLPPAMPEDVLQALERTGYRVRKRRELVPLKMQDGRQLWVPVDKFDFQYVGRPAL